MEAFSMLNPRPHVILVLLAFLLGCGGGDNQEVPKDSTKVDPKGSVAKTPDSESPTPIKQAPDPVAVARIEECLKSGVTTLDLSDSNVSVLPAEIGKLVHVNSVSLARNKLTSLPPEFGRLTKLESLFLSGNQLKRVPSELYRLPRLIDLRLEENQISSLPYEFGDMSSLATLFLNDNPITDEDLKYIKPLKNLAALELSNTKVTKEGIQDLQQALPDCKIYSDFE